MKQYLLSILVLLLITVHTRTQAQTLWGLAYGGGTNNSSGTIFSFNTGTNLPVANYSFGADTDGIHPNGTMLEATDGYFYGTTSQGGSKTAGSIFRYDVTSGDEKVVHSFSDADDGADPGYALIQVNDSMLYGVTEDGGTDNGVIFSYNISSGKEKIVYSFGGDSDALSPEGPLFQLNDSLLYGLSTEGGSHAYGAIYKYNMVTEEESVVHSFASTDTDGRYSIGGLIKATDGLLYGMTYAGGKNNSGTIFNFNPATGVETVLHSFGGFPNGVSPYGTFIQVTDSDLYGVTYEGGNHSVGTIFKYNIYSKITTQLYEFNSTGDGYYPWYGPLFLDGNLLYGMTQMGGANGDGIIFTFNIALDTEIDVYDFNTGSFGEAPKGGFAVYNKVTGVKQLSDEGGQLTVYPNPSSDFIYVNLSPQQAQPVQLSLYNMLGQEVYSTLTPPHTNPTVTIGVTNLPDGVYVLRVNEGNITQQKEVVVAK